VSDSRLQAKATKILRRNNAQEILQALATLEEHRAEFATRWLWELIQNARDFLSTHLLSKQVRVQASASRFRDGHWKAAIGVVELNNHF
jgi:thioesterase domain-containing protein